MELFEWKDSFSVSISKFDEQHKQLISIINELYCGINEKRGKELLNKTLKELFEYTKSHFADEEKEFRRFLYPDYIIHKLEHEKFVRQIAKFNESHKNDIQDLSFEVFKFLQDWLQQHILSTDKKYASFLISKGME